MSFNCEQLRDVIIRPTLQALGLDSPAATNLLLGTCAQETLLGKYLVQVGIGFKGGIGIYQMQKASYQMIWERMVAGNRPMQARMKLLLNYAGMPPAERLASDLVLATAMTRLYYYAINAPLPAADDIPGLAAYWKKWYNTASGKGTEQQFVQNYEAYVCPY